MNSDPIVIPVRRWGYVLYGLLAAAAGGWLVEVAVADKGGFMVVDNVVAWIVAGLIALLLSGVAVAVDYYLHPPEILMSTEGLTLLTPGRERFWQWSQIDQLRIMGQRARHVEFRWHPRAGIGSDRARWQSLDFDVPLLAVQMSNMIKAAQKAAAEKADAASFRSTLEAAREDYPRLTRQQIAWLVGLMIVPLLMMLVLVVFGPR